MNHDLVAILIVGVCVLIFIVLSLLFFVWPPEHDEHDIR